MTVEMILKAADSPKRMVWAEVYAPNRPDSDGEYMDAETIEKMAYEFMRKQLTRKVDVQHDNGLYDGISVIESFVARKGDPDFIPGSWVVGMHIDNDEIWEKVEKGEINGFSVEAMVMKDEVEVSMEIPPVITGTTSVHKEQGDDKGHSHTFEALYDPEGNFIGGRTNVVNGHMHVIKRGTVTEAAADGHSHRFSAVDHVTITED